MSKRIVVVGAGVAGLAAAWIARRLGSEVTVVSAGPGATALGSGAVDDVPWEELLRAARTLGVPPRARALEADALAFARDLGAWDLADDRLSWLATAAGRIRPARGRDRALLDLAVLTGARVLLPRVERAGWDADSLAAALADDGFARPRRLAFVPVDVPILRFEEEHRIADGDLAARHDEDDRIAWLASRLREGIARLGGGAVLLGPWLGARSSRADELSKAVGIPVGEILVGAGSPAGLRFEAAREKLFAALGVRVTRSRVVRIEGDSGISVSLEHGEALAADAVVLAIGGLAGGGVVYDPPDRGAFIDLPAGARPPFSLSVSARVSIAARLSPSQLADALTSETPSSLHGPDLDLITWPRHGAAGALESAGVRCDGVHAGPGIFAAGDVIAARSRTLLEAVVSGIRAGREASS